MTDSRDAAHYAAQYPVRASVRRRNRRRWAIAGAVALLWLILEFMSGALTATIVLVVIAGLGVATVAGLRAMGITRDHPWFRQLASRPWRDGQDVLNVAMRHLPDVFVVTPNGALFAPDIVELALNPEDLAALRQQMELDVISLSVTDVYEKQVAEHRARFAGSGQPEVYVVADNSLPQGRYRLQRGVPNDAREYDAPAQDPGAGFAPEWRYDQPAADPAYDRPASGSGYDRPASGSGYDQPASGSGYDQPAADRGYAPQGYDQSAPGRDYGHPAYAQPVSSAGGERTRYEVVPGKTIMDGPATVLEQIRPAVPVLRLVTNGLIAETTKSGARAGRGVVELTLPNVPTVSREHAKFTFSEGRWWVTSQGLNGLYVNGVPVTDEQPLSDGDSIRWGTLAEAPQSRVEIG
jgi:hypothetical protein